MKRWRVHTLVKYMCGSCIHEGEENVIGTQNQALVLREGNQASVNETMIEFSVKIGAILLIERNGQSARQVECFQVLGFLEMICRK